MRDQRFQLGFQRFFRTFELCDVEGDPLFRGLGRQGVEHVVGDGEVADELFGSRVTRRQRRTVLVQVFDDEFVDDALTHQAAPVFRIVRRIERYDDVGRDSAAAVDGAAATQGFEPLRGVAADRIGSSRFEPFVEIFIIGVQIAVFIRALDHASGRRVVARYGQPHRRAVL